MRVVLVIGFLTVGIFVIFIYFRRKQSGSFIITALTPIDLPEDVTIMGSELRILVQDVLKSLNVVNEINSITSLCSFS